MYFFLIFFLISRSLTFIFLVINNLAIEQNNNYIDQDFIQLFLFNHTLPNGHLVLEKFISLIQFNSNLIFYFLNIFYTLAICILLNDLLKKNLVKEIYRVLVLVTLSVVLLPYETWRFGHHDHINLLIISYLFWSMYYFINYKKKFNDVILSLILLNLFYALGFLYLFIVFAFTILLFLVNNQKFSKWFYFKFSIIFTLVFIIFFKNYISVSIFSPTSMGGANLIQRTVHAIGENKYQKLIEINKQNYPRWWIVLTNKILNNNKNIDSVDLRISNLAHGVVNKDNFLNFKIQKKIIEKYNLSDEELTSYLLKDEFNFKFRKWLYEYGYQQNLISTKYQSFGKSIFLEACKLYPNDMLIGKLGNKGITLTILHMISYAGLLPNYYEIDKKYKNITLNYFNNFLRIIIIIILFLTPIVLLKKIKYKNLGKKDIYYLLLLFSIMINTIISSIITCCENPRMFVMQTFLITMICILNISYIKKDIIRIYK